MHQQSASLLRALRNQWDTIKTLNLALQPGGEGIVFQLG